MQIRNENTVWQDDFGFWFFTHDSVNYGPYDTKQEAADDLRGVRRFDKYKDEPDYITTDSQS